VSENEKKIDLQAELGVSRRDLLRRGAVVGGALLWVAPAIQSLTPPAYAQTVSPQQTTCCACKRPNPTTGFHCGQDHFTLTQCEGFCGGASNVERFAVLEKCNNKNNCVPI
jgi:hypothetical protein